MNQSRNPHIKLILLKLILDIILEPLEVSSVYDKESTIERQRQHSQFLLYHVFVQIETVLLRLYIISEYKLDKR